MFARQWTLTQQRKLLIFRADQSVNNLPITSQRPLIHRSLLCLYRRSRNLVDCLQGVTRTKAKARRWQCLSVPRACTCNTLTRFSAVECLVFSEFLLQMHSHYQLRTIFMGFSDFSPSNTQPLPNVHYDMTFSELLLHIHSHYQMCLLYSMGFSDFFFRIRSHCIHGMSWFLSLQTRPLQIVHYIRGIFWVYSHFWHVKPLRKVCTSHEIFGGIFVCLFCKQCWSYFWSCYQCLTQKPRTLFSKSIHLIASCKTVDLQVRSLLFIYLLLMMIFISRRANWFYPCSLKTI